MPSSRTQRCRTAEPWDGKLQDLQCLGCGVSGLVFAIDDERVAKISSGTPRSIDDIEIERSIYREFQYMRRRTGKKGFRHILSCIELDNPRGLVFERCKGTLKYRLQSTTCPPEQKLKWAIQAARGLRFAHDCNVIQRDGNDTQILSGSNI